MMNIIANGKSKICKKVSILHQRRRILSTPSLIGPVRSQLQPQEQRKRVLGRPQVLTYSRCINTSSSSASDSPSWTSCNKIISECSIRNNKRYRYHPNKSSKLFFSTTTTTTNAGSDGMSNQSSDTVDQDSIFIFGNPSRLPREYINPWSYDDLQPLEISLKLDQQSRYLLNLLTNMYTKTLMYTNDRVTTASANYILQQLLEIDTIENVTTTTTDEQDNYELSSTDDSSDYQSSSPSTSSSSTHSNSNNDDDHHRAKLWYQKADRANAILETMELFDTTFRHNYAHDISKLAFHIPYPNYETYWIVLRLYGDRHLQGYHPPRSGDKASPAPKICEGIVRRMEASKRLELQPNHMHWNQVLASWANSCFEERSIEAAKLLYELHAANNSSPPSPSSSGRDNNNNNNNIAASTSSHKNCTDESSFSHTLRACIPISEEEMEPDSKFSKLALPVAQRVWTALLNEHYKRSSSSAIKLQSFHAVHMLRVTKNIADPGRRTGLIKEIMDIAIQNQIVTVQVLTALFHVDTSKSILKYHYLHGKNHSRDAKKAIHEIPKHWLETKKGEYVLKPN